LSFIVYRTNIIDVYTFNVNYKQTDGIQWLLNTEDVMSENPLMWEYHISPYLLAEEMSYHTLVLYL